MNILVLNGPNLNLLGIREPEIYGTDTLEELMMWLESCPESINHKFKFYQSNHEGDLIDYIHDERQWSNGIIINPGALTHYSYAIYDALKAVNINCVEVHLTSLDKREDFRKKSEIKSASLSQISGLGKQSYLEGLKLLINK